MYKIAIFLLLVFGLLMPSCTPESNTLVRGSGNLTTETRPLGSLHGVQLGLPGSMEITLGDKETITIEAEDNIIAVDRNKSKWRDSPGWVGPRGEYPAHQTH